MNFEDELRRTLAENYPITIIPPWKKMSEEKNLIKKYNPQIRTKNLDLLIQCIYNALKNLKKIYDQTKISKQLEYLYNDLYYVLGYQITPESYKQIYLMIQICSNYKDYFENNKKIKILLKAIKNKLISEMQKMLSNPEISPQQKRQIKTILIRLDEINFETNNYQILKDDPFGNYEIYDGEGNLILF